jgi:hypothetical protein
MHPLKGLCWLALLVVLATARVSAQQARAAVTMTGHVSSFAAVSAGQGASVVRGGAQISAAPAGAHTLIFSLSGQADDEAQVDIPVQLRSNAAFTLTAWAEKGGAAILDLSVVGVGGAGRLVHPGAAGRVEVSAAFDGRLDKRPADVRHLSSPATILSGPVVSMGGTLDSPANMLEVVLRVVFKAADAGRDKTAELKVSVAPRRQGW